MRGGGVVGVGVSSRLRLRLRSRSRTVKTEQQHTNCAENERGQSDQAIKQANYQAKQVAKQAAKQNQHEITASEWRDAKGSTLFPFPFPSVGASKVPASLCLVGGVKLGLTLGGFL